MVVDISRSPLDFNKALKVSNSGACKFSNSNERTGNEPPSFRQLGIYSASGQLYQPEDSDKVMWYKEDKKGQVLQEGINEAGAVSDWIAAATSYATP
jgi:pyruvate dehydrogenase complex dehydrogenase (E1) component